MSDNKQLYENDLEFDDEIDFEGLEDFSDEISEDIIEADLDISIQEISDFEPETAAEEYESSELQPEDGVLYDEQELSEQSEEEAEEFAEVVEEAGESTVDEESYEPKIITEQVDEPFAEAESDTVEEVFVLPEIDESEVEDVSESENRGDMLVNRFCIINTAISAVTLCAVAAGITFGYNYINSIEEKLEIKSAEIVELEKKNEELEEDYLEVMNTIDEESGEDSLVDVSETDNGKIVFYDTSVGYSWAPVLSGIEQNNYKKENFIVDNRGRISYIEDGESASYFGIDVSSYQGDIDWQLVREDNVEFAFLRIGYRGYGEEGKLCPDENFVDNYNGAHDVGIDLGVYFFSQAATVEEAVEEAHYVLSLLEGRTLEYPIVFDWETVQTGDPEDIPRTEDVMPGTLTLSAIAFCETIRDAGYDAMIYTNKKLATIKYDLRQLQDYPIWLAYYNTELDYRYAFDIWQYGTGQVDGIEGEVDINIAMIK